ncbi:hypothetical protein KIH39_14655 [Telmatocola sphagniphila]|uniref:Porin n=1 Tax=Telmatocola sphagniphila TaxID=1123043 RepID=A0A8E6B2J1_9BACT|nr:Lpg1974 family pore-forming outer membrane protein [Telmatocola sphagniphila]QVL30099.1 hypothetical protein KIH39_14655 [Telmatocola sphagniphila]
MRTWLISLCALASLSEAVAPPSALAQTLNTPAPTVNNTTAISNGLPVIPAAPTNQTQTPLQSSPPAAAGMGNTSSALPPTNTSWLMNAQIPPSPPWGPVLIDSSEVSSWYGGFEIGFLKPKLFTSLTTPAAFNGPVISQTVSSIDWAGAPKLTAGYRLSEGMGELQLSYRLLASSGSETLGVYDTAGPGLIRSRLNANTIDLDYVAPEFLGEGRETSHSYFRYLSFGIGLRVATLYFDTQGAGRQLLNQDISSMFTGIGPRTFVEWNPALTDNGLALHTRLEASGVVGSIDQKFYQTALNAGMPQAAAYNTGSHNTGVGIGSFEAGLTYTPLGFENRLRFTLAYSLEQWWNVNTDDSKAKLFLQGIVARAEFSY